MSQFAHGISSLELTSSSALASPVWLLGSYYDTDIETYTSHFYSILWYTYRRDFQPLTPYNYTTDAGWGCMLRSAQMILSEAFQRVFFKQKERFDFNTTLPTEYKTLLQWFIDSSDSDSIYSLHHLVQLGLTYDQLPGEWYGPTTVALILKDVVNCHCRERKGPLLMYVPQEGVVYSDEVDHLMLPIEDSVPIEGDKDYDPLFNVPDIRTIENKVWKKSLFILLPLRLGLDSLNTCYVAAIKEYFTFPQCIGIIGGKKGHSVYFIGSQKDSLQLLDPHYVQNTTEYHSTSFPTVTHLSTIHAANPLSMHLESIDPSMAFGFICHTQEDYTDFYTRIKRMENELGIMNCPFSVATQRPTYSSTMEDDELEEEEEALKEKEIKEEEEEYVLI